MRRAVLATAILAALSLPGAATASPLLDDGDAAELAQSLAEATAEQAVCYGWHVQVDDGSGGPSGPDIGSNAGPNVAVDSDRRCRRVVTLTGTVTYTCGWCESEDSSSMSVTSNFPGGPTEDDLEELGLGTGDLHADDGDVVLANLVGALPIVAASNGVAPPVPADVNRRPIPAADGATNSPSTPDWLRDSWLALTCFLVLAAFGAGWLVVQRIRRPSDPEPE